MIATNPISIMPPMRR